MTNSSILKRTAAALTFSAAAIVGSGEALAQQVFTTDVIIQGSLCVGIDCAAGTSFGFDTQILKENNLRIFFDDTSASASFPNNDWRIVINDTSNGGSSYYAIEDATAGRQVFRVEAGAPVNSLYVDDGGRIGIGTSTPVVNVHVVDGNTPTVRLDQNGSDGFTPQTWDLAGNETNFFLRDVTNGSRLPFRVFPNAPTNALTVEGTTGDIGVGIQAATAALHVSRTDSALVRVANTTATSSGRDMMRLENMGPPRLALTNNDTSSGGPHEWTVNVRNNGIFRINKVGVGTNEFDLDAAGNLVITGTITTSGSCSIGCDRVFDTDYELPTIAQHAQAMFENRHLPAVGVTTEGKPINLTLKVEGMLNELEKAHIYIDQLHQRLAELELRTAQ